MESFSSTIQTLIKTNKDFPQKFKQRLVLESHNVTNPLKFMVALITEGALSDGSNDTEASVDLKRVIVELAMMMVCSKGADAIGGLTKALEESGNLPLISTLRTWIKEDFSMETQVDRSEPKGAAAVQTATSKKLAKKQMKNSTQFESAAAVQTATSKKLTKKQMQNSTQLESNAAILTDKIVSRMEDDFMEQLESYWLGQASKIFNVLEFSSILAQQKVLNESGMQLKTGMESKEEQWAQGAIKAAVSKRAIASLVLAFQLSGNNGILEDTQAWLETSQIRKNNYPITVKALPKQLKHQTQKLVMSHFFQQAPPSSELKKVATFNCSPESFEKGKSALQFNREKMTACLAGSTVKLWNWRENGETTIKFAEKMEGLTACHFDDEIIVLGTEAGTIHLFDARTLEEKWSVRLGQPVNSLQIANTMLGVATQHGHEHQLWWVEVSRSDMRMLNQRPVMTNSENKAYGYLIGIDENSFLYFSKFISVRHSKSGSIRMDDRDVPLVLVAPDNINSLAVVDLIGGKSFVVAGCKNGFIATWDLNPALRSAQKPKSLQGHQNAIVSLCAINGHLLSVCEGGKLLMWSGYDVQNEHVTPIPRVLAENFHNVTSLVACERWFASSSAEDGTISVWALPDLWLRTG